MMPADTEVSSSIDKAELLRRLHAILPAASLLHDPEELSHLQAGSSLPVRHWIELIDAVLAGTLQAHSPAEQSTLLATGSPMTAHPNPKPTPVKGGFGEQ